MFRTDVLRAPLNNPGRGLEVVRFLGCSCSFVFWDSFFCCWSGRSLGGRRVGGNGGLSEASRSLVRVRVEGAMAAEEG